MNILVLCTGNSARSILLESILNRLGDGSLTAYSAGSQPAGRVNPGAITLLEKKGHATDGLRSKSWDEFALAGAPVMSLVITVCGNARDEACPMWPGAPVRAHWGVEDPAVFDVGTTEATAAFETAYALLLKQAEQFIDRKPANTSEAELRAILSEMSED